MEKKSIKDDFQEIRNKLFDQNYVPEYPAKYIQNIKESVLHKPAFENSIRHANDLIFLQAIKEGRAR